MSDMSAPKTEPQFRGDGRSAYEADVAAHPTYHDGTPRRTWAELSDSARWSWNQIARQTPFPAQK